MSSLFIVIGMILDLNSLRADKYSTANISLGESFWIEKFNYKNNTYEKLYTNPEKNCAFNAIGYILMPGKDLELKQDWSCFYGELDKGLYRLVKDVDFTSDRPIDNNDMYYIWVEFEIEK